MAAVHANSRFNPNRDSLSLINFRQTDPDFAVKYMTKWPLKCLAHDEAVTSFCSDHDALVCHVCTVTNHAMCGSITTLAEAARGMRGNKECEAVRDSLRKMTAAFEKSKDGVGAKIKHLNDQERNFIQAVTDFRSSIDAILDRLQLSVMAKKDSYVSAKRTELNNMKCKCKEAVNILNITCRELDKSFVSPDEQTIFVTTKKTKFVLNKFENVLKKTKAVPKKSINLAFLPNTIIEKFFSNVGEFGAMRAGPPDTRENLPSVSSTVLQLRRMTPHSDIATSRSLVSTRGSRPSLASTASTFPVRSLMHRQAQRPISNGEIDVQLTSDEEVPFITGTSFMPDDYLVVADDTNRNIKVFDKAFKAVGVFKLTSPPRDVTSLSVKDIAVTLPAEKVIQLVQISKPLHTFQARKRLTLDIECSGITCHDNKLYVTSGFSKNREILVVGLDGTIRKRMRPGLSELRYPLYIVVDATSETIYVTDYNHGVVGLDMNGAVKFKCKDTDVHSYYKGIAISRNGQIYVCTWQLFGISRVHTDGRGMETIISVSDQDGRKPHAVAYSKRSRSLVVSMCGPRRGTLSVYMFRHGHDMIVSEDRRFSYKPTNQRLSV